MEAEEQRRQMSPEGEEENEASLSLPCGRQKWCYVHEQLNKVHTVGKT